MKRVQPSGPATSASRTPEANLSDKASSSGEDATTAGASAGGRHAKAVLQTSAALHDLAAVLVVLTVISLLFQKLAPEAYMDEPFHIPQTQQYCQGRFTDWDPKITTFPGLYLVGAAVGSAWHGLRGFVGLRYASEAQLCGTGVLRSVNVAFGAAVFLLSRALYFDLRPSADGDFASCMGFAVLLLPTSFFYVFLYYTDVGSLACVLATLLLSSELSQTAQAARRRRFFLAGAAAAAAVLFRQTNAVWVVLAILEAVLQLLSAQLTARLQHSGLAEQVVILLLLCWRHKRALLSKLWPLLTVPVAFATFVAWNGGIVVGDRAHHTPVLHLVQPLYCLLFAAAALSQMHLHPARLSEAFWRATHAIRRRPASVLKPAAMAFTLAAYAVHNNTLVHPFMLADNRHYVFYIWKDVIGVYPAARYCLVPLYVYAGWSVRDAIRAGGQLDVWATCLAACATLTLVPAWLVELRYFTTPVVLALLYAAPPTARQLGATLAIFAAVNAATIYVFLLRPYVWVDGSTARFMW